MRSLFRTFTSNLVFHMKPLFRLSAFFLVLAITGSCSKSPACRGGDEDKGIIVKDYSMRDFPMCVEAYVNEHQQMVITSEEELAAIVDSNCINLPEAGYSTVPPEIEFNTHSLLGFWATGRCETKFTREVSENETDKKYVYEIRVKECGACESERYDANLVLVPKLPAGYSVDFIIRTDK